MSLVTQFFDGRIRFMIATKHDLEWKFFSKMKKHIESSSTFWVKEDLATWFKAFYSGSSFLLAYEAGFEFK